MADDKMSKISMQKIADQLGITKVTVSKALNNQPGVSDALRDEIIKIANDLGYVKNSKNKQRFAYIVPKRFFLENEKFYSTIYYYLNRKCHDARYDIVSYVINSKDESELLIPEQLSSENFDGLFIAGELSEKYLCKLSFLKMPTIAIDFYEPDYNFDSIIVDNFCLGYNSTKYLINKGHRKIGFVGHINQTNSIMDRYYGYVKAIEKNNLPLSDDWLITNNDPITGIYFLDFNLPKDMPDAFVCHCDMAAYYLIQKMQSLGIEIPRDVSIISFDNTELSDLIIPKLTTIDISKKKFAEKAFKQMINRIAYPNSEPQRIYINTNLIFRDSIAERHT